MCFRYQGLSRAAAQITALISRNGVASDLDEVGGTNSDGDSQKALDVRAEEVILDSLAGSGAAMLLSEEQEGPVPVNDDGSLIVAVDPLDGSSNISVNVTIGTIFSILPDGAVLQNGRAQRAAGFFTYGPQTTLVLAFADGGGVACFVFDPASPDTDGGEFVSIDTDVTIPQETNEFSINAAYANHWFPPVQDWMAEICRASQAPRGKDYRMRWVGRWWLMPGVFSVVAVFSSIRVMPGRVRKTDGCGWSMKPTRSLFWLKKQAARPFWCGCST